MRSAGWSGSTTWQRSSGRRPPSTRPGPTVQPSLLPPSFPGLQTHACAHTYTRTLTHTEPLLPVQGLSVC